MLPRKATETRIRSDPPLLGEYRHVLSRRVQSDAEALSLSANRQLAFPSCLTLDVLSPGVANRGRQLLDFG